MRYRIRKERLEDYAFDLNIAPMLDMLVTLVPFLLLSSAFLRIVMIDSPLPSNAAAQIESTVDKKDKEVSLKLFLTPQSGKLEITINGAKEIKTISLKDGKLDLESMHAELVKVKVKNPNVFRLEVHPESNVSYKDIIQVMDEARNLKASDPKVYIQDKQTNQQVPTELLFPDTILANVTEG